MTKKTQVKSRQVTRKAVIYIEVPPALKDALQAAASAERRSLTAQVTLLLEKLMIEAGRYSPVD